MIVFATGARGNGTSLLHRIIDSGDRIGKTTFHLPAYPPELMDWSELLPRSLFVVIVRDQVVRCSIHVRAGIPSNVRGGPVRAEDLVAFPTITIGLVDQFLRRHGYAGAPLTHEPIRDENAKWLIRLSEQGVGRLGQHERSAPRAA